MPVRPTPAPPSPARKTRACARRYIGTAEELTRHPSLSQNQKITKPPASLLTRSSIIKKLATSYKWPQLAYDGSKQLFAPSGHASLAEAHRQDGVTYQVERPEDVPGEAGEYFAVRIKFAVPVRVKDAIDAHLRGDVGSELIPAAAFQALDAILRHERAMNPLWVSIGRNFLDSKNTVKLSGGFEVWKGYSLSARPTQGAEGKGATHLVVNMAAGAFISEQSAVDRLCVLSDGRGGGGGGGRGRGDMRSGGPDAPRLPRLPLDERTWREAHAAFKGIKIELTHFPGSRRKKTCRGLTKLPANRQMFRDDTGRVNLSKQEFLKSRVPLFRS